MSSVAATTGKDPALDPPDPADARRQRIPGPTLLRHIGSTLPGPALFILAVLTIVVLTQDMLAFSDLVMNRGLEAGSVAALAIDRAIPALAWMVPFATLLGCLVALGKLSSDTELFLIEASGISVLRLMVPFGLFALLMAGVGLWLSLDGAPGANRRLDARLARMAVEKPWATLMPGVVHRFGDYKLTAREIASSGDRLTDVQLYMPSLGETVFAETGALEPADDGRILLRLSRGRALLDPREEARVLHVDELVTWLPGSGSDLVRTDVEQMGGMSLGELKERGDREARVALHRRFTWPVAAVLFGLLSVPLFVRGARVSRSGGLMLGVVVMVVYQGLVQGANGLLWSGSVSPWVAAWLPNLVVAVAVLVLPLGLNDRPSFQPRPEPSKWRERLRWRRSDRALRARRRPLGRYVAQSFLGTLLLCLAGLLVCYLIVDVFQRLDRFVRYAPPAVDLIRFYAARLPLLASRVVPLAMLVATALTVSILGSRGELVGMRACGVPAWRGLMPILLVSALAVPTFFLLNDRVIPRTTALADRINDLIKDRPTGNVGANVWYREGDAFYEAERFDPEAGVASQLIYYELDASGLPLARTDASSALHVGEGLWRMEDRVRVGYEGGLDLDVVRDEPMARMGSELPQNVDTRHLSVGELRREIGVLERSGVDATRFRVDLWTKLATPLACLLLPALALFFSLGGPPHPSTSATLVFSATVAVTWILLTGLGASLGYGGTLPAPLAAFSPAFLFLVASLVMGRRLHIFR